MSKIFLQFDSGKMVVFLDYIDVCQDVYNIILIIFYNALKRATEMNTMFLAKAYVAYLAVPNPFVLNNKIC